MADKKTFVEIMMEELETDKEKVQLDEGLVPFTPFIAFSAFKQKVFNAFKNNKLFQTFKSIDTEGKKLKGQALVGAEKIRASLGASSHGTVYKLTPQQVSIMGTIYNKYGKQLVNDILNFRKNVLAPYQVIKRIIKSSSRVSSKDITGLSKEEYKASTESGRKKIQARGPQYFEKVEDIRKRMEDYTNQIEGLETLRKDFEQDVPDIDYNIVNKVFKHFDIGEAPEGFSKEELKKVYDEIMKNYKVLLTSTEQEDLSPEDFKRLRDTRKRQRALWAGKSIDLTTQKKEEFFKKGSFNLALGKYFFAREIIKKLTEPGVFNIFKKTYVSIIGEMLQKVTESKKELLSQLISMKKVQKFSDKESKTWGKLPHIKSQSGNEADYYQKLKDEDFLKQPLVIHRSQELIDAERKIENEIKKFEHQLKTIISEEDFDSLRRNNLIGNLITIKELRSPKALFKSRAELMDQSGEAETKPNEVPEEKKEAPEEKEKASSKIELVDIEEAAKKIVEKEYDNFDAIKRDEENLKQLIKQYQEIEPKSAEKLASIKFLFDRIENKVTKLTSETK